FEPLPDEFAQRFIIFGDKNSHKSEPSLIEQPSLVRNASPAGEFSRERRYGDAKTGAEFERGIGSKRMARDT
ncbi:MAG TPA: hypothetical protein VJQ59_05715, partial [Candidatus Sulfotelmatobacter sp.]|nr:hypothetical protein [Candidatus Sulfotelmatobacter sp.]